MNNKHHENLGINYLLKLGYKEENIRSNYWSGDGESGKPDLTTIDDNKNWEIKVTRGNIVIFTSGQLIYMANDDNVLIFSEFKKDEPIDIVTFGDILDGKYDDKYKFIFDFNLDISWAGMVLEYLIDSGYYTNTEDVHRSMMALKRQYLHIMKPLTTIYGEKVISPLVKDGVVQVSDESYIISFLTSYKDLFHEIDSAEKNKILMTEIRDDILKYLFFQLDRSEQTKKIITNPHNKWIRSTLRKILSRLENIDLITREDIDDIMDKGIVSEKYIKVYT